MQEKAISINYGNRRWSQVHPIFILFCCLNDMAIFVTSVFGDSPFLLCFIRKAVSVLYNECWYCLEMDCMSLVTVWVIISELKWFVRGTCSDVNPENISGRCNSKCSASEMGTHSRKARGWGLARFPGSRI